MKIEKMEKTSGGIHLKNICTKFEVNPSILKMSKFRGTDVTDTHTDRRTTRKYTRMYNCERSQAIKLLLMYMGIQLGG